MCGSSGRRCWHGVRLYSGLPGWIVWGYGQWGLKLTADAEYPRCHHRLCDPGFYPRQDASETKEAAEVQSKSFLSCFFTSVVNVCICVMWVILEDDINTTEWDLTFNLFSKEFMKADESVPKLKRGTTTATKTEARLQQLWVWHRSYQCNLGSMNSQSLAVKKTKNMLLTVCVTVYLLENTKRRKGAGALCSDYTNASSVSV